MVLDRNIKFQDICGKIDTVILAIYIYHEIKYNLYFKCANKIDKDLIDNLIE